MTPSSSRSLLIPFLLASLCSGCAALLNQQGILKLRGTWATAFGRPALPMTHPAYLLRTPLAKREAWADILSLSARLEGGGAS